MAKTKTLSKQVKYSGGKRMLQLKKGANVKEHHPEKTVLNEEFIAKAIWECLKNNDPEGVLEVIQIHLAAVNVSKKAKETELARSSMYSAIKGRNPTIKTLAKMINCCF